MNQKHIDNILSNTNKHLIDITGCGNWFCRDELDIKTSPSLRGITETNVNSMRFCPFCGATLSSNIKI